MKTPPLLLQTGDKGTENLLRTVAVSKEFQTVAKITHVRTTALQYCVIASKHGRTGLRFGSLMLLLGSLMLLFAGRAAVRWLMR
jgi:hypothetical protein